MGCVSGIAKYLIFLFNFLIFICAILLIVLGALLKKDEDIGISSFENLSVSNLAIAVGVLIALISFFGCCGAIKESSCLLTTYAAILITLFIIQIVLGALAFVAIKNDSNEFTKKVNEYVTDLFKQYRENKNDAIKAVDAIQDSLSCCGVNGFIDYISWGILVLPKSCCDGDASVCIKPYATGCASALEDKLISSSKVIGGIAIGFAVVELVGALFALYVRNSIRR